MVEFSHWRCLYIITTTTISIVFLIFWKPYYLGFSNYIITFTVSTIIRLVPSLKINMTVHMKWKSSWRRRMANSSIRSWGRSSKNSQGRRPLILFTTRNRLAFATTIRKWVHLELKEERVIYHRQALTDARPCVVIGVIISMQSLWRNRVTVSSYGAVVSSAKNAPKLKVYTLVSNYANWLP